MLYGSVFSVELYKLVVSLSLNWFETFVFTQPRQERIEKKKSLQQMKTFLPCLPSP